VSNLKTLIICMVIGEGCSGGALGIGIGDRVMMLQYSYYATISPEGCATILFKRADKAKEAAEMMGITAEKLLALDLIDEIVPEPLGGAHRDINKMASTIKQRLIEHLDILSAMPVDDLIERRFNRLMSLGQL
jgi:acetyl-CoA carboxylase carboxyl transferase subunit alpha